ncbi:MAG: GNAT family N-acetyltransferase [Terriglobales bacterium]|jgi:CelD/BcsL family acetyltransferase involved in cellulose biosynthesis
MSLALEVFPSMQACEPLRAEWEELLHGCPNATVFDSFGWINANVLAFTNSETWILTLRDAGSALTGVIPLVVRLGRRYLRARRWLEFAGQPYADYASCLVRTGYEEPVAHQLIEFCCSKAGGWDGVFLDRLRVGTAFLDCVVAAAKQRGLHAATRETDHVRQLTRREFTGASAHRHSGKSLRKSRNRLLERGEIGFEVLTSAEAILRLLEKFFSWHAGRFAAKGMQSPLSDPQHRAFYRHMVEQLAPQGRIWLSALTCGGDVIAMKLSPVFNGMLHLYSTCFDEAYAKYSPSMLQLEMLIEHAFRSGIECVDFGIGESPQKDYGGAAVGQTLARVAIYRDRIALLEGRCYESAERMRSHSRLITRGGKFLRRIFPYDVR